MLPPVDDLRRRCKALAALDAALCPRWDDRYFLYDADWGPGETMASMRGDGAGFFITFRRGAAFCVFHDDGTRGAPPTALPPEMREIADEPAFQVHAGAVHAWRRPGDADWATDGDVEAREGAPFLTGGAGAYCDFAEDYFEVDIDRDAVARFMADLDAAALAARLLADDPAGRARFLEEAGGIL